MYGINVLVKKLLYSKNNQPWILKGTVNGKNSQVVTQDPKNENSITLYRSDNQEGGAVFSYSFWFVIENMDYKYGEWKHMFHKGNKNGNPNRAPGVWLHPYINDLRIVVTTQSGNKKTEYDQYLNEMIHPYKETSFSKLRNYNIEPIDLEDIISTEEATISDKQTLNISVAEKEEQIDSKIKEIKSHGGENKEEHSKLINDLQALTKEKEDLIKNTDNNVVSENTGGCIGKGEFNGVSYYREYFDVKNVPIKEKFHIAIIMNEKLVEIYINGNLHTSQTLFGEPRYNSGPLHISPGKNDKEADLKLNGVITDFKYYTHAINYINIRNIIAEKSVIQDTEAVILPEEHTHNVEVVHDHHHDILNEAEHKHGISDENVKTDYYLED